MTEKMTETLNNINDVEKNYSTFKEKEMEIVEEEEINERSKPRRTHEESSSKKNSEMLSYYGLFFAIISSLLAALSNVYMKKAAFFNGAEQALAKYSVQLVVISILILFNKHGSFLGVKEDRIKLSIRGFFAVAQVLAFYFSFSFIVPSDTMALNRISIVLVAIASRFLFKEMLNVIYCLAILLTLAGKNDKNTIIIGV